MKTNANVTVLNVLAHEKKNSKDLYYTISWLDESDVSWNVFISSDLYKKAVEILKVKRFDEVMVDVNLFKSADGKGYSFSVLDINKCPFEKK